MTQQKELCVRCKKSKATLTYSNSQMDMIHGFTERICQECYDKQVKESNWYKQGFKEGKQETETKILGIIDRKRFISTPRDTFNQGYARAVQEIKKELTQKIKEKLI